MKIDGCLAGREGVIIEGEEEGRDLGGKWGNKLWGIGRGPEQEEQRIQGGAVFSTFNKKQRSSSEALERRLETRRRSDRDQICCGRDSGPSVERGELLEVSRHEWGVRSPSQEDHSGCHAENTQAGNQLLQPCRQQAMAWAGAGGSLQTEDTTGRICPQTKCGVYAITVF